MPDGWDATKSFYLTTVQLYHVKVPKAAKNGAQFLMYVVYKGIFCVQVPVYLGVRSGWLNDPICIATGGWPLPSIRHPCDTLPSGSVAGAWLAVFLMSKCHRIACGCCMKWHKLLCAATVTSCHQGRVWHNPSVPNVFQNVPIRGGGGA